MCFRLTSNAHVDRPRGVNASRGPVERVVRRRARSREHPLLDRPGVRERSIGRQSLDDNTLERRGIPGCVDGRDLRIKGSQGESTALLKNRASPTAVAIKPDQAHTLRPKLIDDGQAVDRKAPVESHPLVVLFEQGHKGFSRRFPCCLELWMRPTPRMALQIVVRKAIRTSEVTPESALSCRWHAGEQDQALLWNRHWSFTSKSSNAEVCRAGHGHNRKHGAPSPASARATCYAPSFQSTSRSERACLKNPSNLS